MNVYLLKFKGLGSGDGRGCGFGGGITIGRGHTNGVGYCYYLNVLQNNESNMNEMFLNQYKYY